MLSTHRSLKNCVSIAGPVHLLNLIGSISRVGAGIRAEGLPDRSAMQGGSVEEHSFFFAWGSSILVPAHGPKDDARDRHAVEGILVGRS